ncbi:hypothetical protein AMATHDRAFT_4951 [Amanita thiersii Skay4041]|uniref:Uncharacterized protein n=1 Tax=Amanita thiersii Skay4041 TaxID=703135 RepID=A0A2A9NNW7_9AGAR|nr:hypothetical protein AMATHDRAFT_4951 [Amanita thiersii Skay4041]
MKRQANHTSDSDLYVMQQLQVLQRTLAEAYNIGLSQYTAEAFTEAGYPFFTHGRMKQIAEHEKTHISFLSTAISSYTAQPPLACEYQFTFQGIGSFIQTVHELGTIITSAFSGSIAFIEHKEYITLLASTLGVKSRHVAWLGSAVQKMEPWNTAFETPLTRNHVYSLISRYIKNCPDTSTLDFTLFPSLDIPRTGTPGKRVKIQFTLQQDQDLSPSHMWVAFLTGEGIKYEKIHAIEKSGSKQYEVTIPKDIYGATYAILTNSDRHLEDKTTIAGPALMLFDFDSRGYLV